MKWILLGWGLLVSNCVLALDLNMPNVFSDHMVLQRDQAVPVWGTTDAGATVVVEFAGRNMSTVADDQGKWRIDLAALDASAQSRILKVSAALKGDQAALQFEDVLVGEVWLCGGQSNMDFTLKMLSGKARDPQYEPVAEYLREEIATADDPLFRHFKVARQTSPYEEQVKAPGEWMMAVPGQVQNFTGTGYFFGRELRRELNVPVALLGCNWGGTRVEPWIPMSAFEKDESLKSYYDKELTALRQRADSWDEAAEKKKFGKKLKAWKVKAEEAKAAGKPAPRKPGMPQHPDLGKTVPSTLYNGMLYSLVPYGIKGAIWYQGESNRAHYPEAYAQRFASLIDAWREQWGQEKLFFYWCQLAKYTHPNEEPVGDEDGWCVVCNAQRLTLSLPDTGMAVLNDIGEAKDIHPKNKVDAGKRLSLWALNQAYGQENVMSGPLYKDAKIKGSKVIIRFDAVGTGLMVGSKHLMDPGVGSREPLKRFQICGADGNWKWADAEIISKDRVKVWHADVQQPVEVRYAWSANAEGANLYNKEGLPASMFKTEGLK